ncbi:DUF499 domain-containing protein [Streptomyces lavendulae]|uniref:DUF499 domain-containing protein n=1 Tax=Streptomyces lavendulae TaxID=1914 RepID=UPI003680BFB1
MTSLYPHWADLLALRSEITDADGQIADLQMSLYSAVYTDRYVPYADPGYYAEITEPTPRLVQFMSTVARRLGTRVRGGKALFHLDQGMGGGKSHALVGLYHLANTPVQFLTTELGRQVKAEAEQRGVSLDLDGARVVVLSADNMTPGATSPEFGPASTLYERFLWSLFKGDQVLYAQHLAEGANKAALARALEAVDGPVLILLDELMQYALALSDERHLGSMPGEKFFLDSLMDAVDEVDSVAFVIVMIRSDRDDRGYPAEAESLRTFVTSGIERNGISDSVTEPQDFSAIIRRRLFKQADDLPVAAAANAWQSSAGQAWSEQVFGRLGARRGLAGLEERLAASYPFSPDLMALVRDDWSRHAGFQRVRSTVEIFSATAYHWKREHDAGRWAPGLIGVGDLPLHVAIENILSSGLLHGNERVIQGYRQVAATDVTTKDGAQGRARGLDTLLVERGVDAGQPAPALRMATALFSYSLVPRAQAKRGATKPELLAAVYAPGVEFHAAEEVFNTLISDEEGLGALDVTDTATGRGIARYHLAVAQTLRMFYKQAKNSIEPADRDTYLWERAKAIARGHQGPFDQVIPVAAPDAAGMPLAQVFSDVDQNSKTRLVILDPRRWTLHNGRDTPTRAEVAVLLGVGEQALPVDNAASCIIACVNTQRRDAVRKRTVEVLAWRAVIAQLDPEDDKRADAQAELRNATQRVDDDLQRAFQHFAHLTRTDQIEVDWQRFDDDTKTALKGGHVWDALANNSRAVYPGKLSGTYLKTLLNKIARDLTLKEIGQQFYKNPAFPLIPSVDDIRRAVYQTLSGSEPYQVIDGEGTAQQISSSDELSIGSMELTLRKAPLVSADDAPVPTANTAGTPGRHAVPAPRPALGGSDAQGQLPSARHGEGGEEMPAPEYRNYRLEIPNRSVVSHETRRAIANLLQDLLDVVDPEVGGDIQLLDLQLSLTAVPDAVEKIEQSAEAAEVSWDEEELDF